MGFAEIVRFGPDLPKALDDSTWEKAAEALQGHRKHLPFVIGTEIQNSSVVQITADWHGPEDHTDFETTPEGSAYGGDLQSLLGSPTETFHVSFDKSIVGDNGPATANVTEFVRSVFPVSRLTPEFQKQIETDFSAFEEIYQRGDLEGERGLAVGWTLEEVDHPDIQGEKTRSFIVARGWERFEDFEKALQNEHFEEAIKILYAWSAPFRMWHIQRKIDDKAAR